MGRGPRRPVRRGVYFPGGPGSVAVEVVTDVAAPTGPGMGSPGARSRFVTGRLLPCLGAQLYSERCVYRGALRLAINFLTLTARPGPRKRTISHLLTALGGREVRPFAEHRSCAPGLGVRVGHIKLGSVWTVTPHGPEFPHPGELRIGGSQRRLPVPHRGPEPEV